MIRRALRFLGVVLLVFSVGTAGFAGWVYVASERYLHSFVRPAPFRLPIPTHAEAVARGAHLVLTRGCRGCHGARLEGAFMFGHALAPNLGKLSRAVSAAEFEAALRHGIDHSGRAMYDMPAYNFIRLRDDDVADILAYLRSLPETAEPPGLPAPTLPWRIRLNLARGNDHAIAGILHKVPQLARQQDPDPRIARGEYIAMTTCIECHGLTLHADSPFDDETAPDLAIIAAYDEAAFTRLMRTGKALGNRELEMMSGVARGRFAHFSDEEVRDLYAFLHQMAQPH